MRFVDAKLLRKFTGDPQGREREQFLAAFIKGSVIPVEYGLRAEAARPWAVGIAVGLLLPAVLFPTVLTPIYRVWMTIGDTLGWINTRIILSLVFYALFTPLGVIRRVLLKKDSLHLAFEPEAETYRIVRQPRPHAHIERQF